MSAVPETRPAGGDGAPVVGVIELAKSYRRGPEEVHALRSVSLRLAPGEVVGLIGRSGSGKTTLLNLLTGWEAPDHGAMYWNGKLSSTAAQATLPWSELAVLPQSLGLIEELSVRENVELPARLGGSLDEALRARVDALLESLGLTRLATRAPLEVSLGEQQRTALARSLVLGPRLLLVDEPTGHQDAVSAKAVFEAIRAAAEEGSACLVATHNPEALRYLTRILRIADGRLETPSRPSPPEDPARAPRTSGPAAPGAGRAGRGTTGSSGLVQP